MTLFLGDGGAEGIRTPGLVNASHALCQLSYSPLLIALKWYEINFHPVKECDRRGCLSVMGVKAW